MDSQRRHQVAGGRAPPFKAAINKRHAAWSLVKARFGERSMPDPALSIPDLALVANKTYVHLLELWRGGGGHRPGPWAQPSLDHEAWAMNHEPSTISHFWADPWQTGGSWKSWMVVKYLSNSIENENWEFEVFGNMKQNTFYSQIDLEIRIWKNDGFSLVWHFPVNYLLIFG